MRAIALSNGALFQQLSTMSLLERWRKSSTGEPRYPWSFYLRIRLFTFEILLKRAKFLVKMCLFICEFSIRGPK
jgi:hypothetical protein